jgi:hypothetical protein
MHFKYALRGERVSVRATAAAFEETESVFSLSGVGVSGQTIFYYVKFKVEAGKV